MISKSTVRTTRKRSAALPALATTTTRTCKGARCNLTHIMFRPKARHLLQSYSLLNENATSNSLPYGHGVGARAYTTCGVHQCNRLLMNAGYHSPGRPEHNPHSLMPDNETRNTLGRPRDGPG